MDDLIIYDQKEENKITLTGKEISNVIANNEEQDVTGVEKDLQDLIDQRRFTDIPLYITVISVTPFSVVTQLGNKFHQEEG